MAKTKMDNVTMWNIENATSLEELENWADYYEDHREMFSKKDREKLENTIQTRRNFFRRNEE